ncbi:hypothetical protein P692DRAFT_20878595 [Suillus brevipes Sb2]|nr:hypothetical protein P692DRAFT_20878595 [Suillus brevipes Sb2]
MYGSQNSQQRPSGAAGFPTMQNPVSQDQQRMTIDAPYNFSSTTGRDQSRPSPLAQLTPGLPQVDDVFGRPHDGLVSNQHTGPGGHITSSPEFAHMSPFGSSHEQQTPSHPMRAPSVPFTPSSHGRSPYLGHSDSRTPFSNGSDPSSRAPSLGPVSDYNLFPYHRQQQQMSTHSLNRPSLGLYQDAGYHRDDTKNQICIW